MKVILLKDVKGVGKSGELITTSDGHAMNLLIPKKMGVQATPAELAKYEARKAGDAHELERLQVLAKRMEGEVFKLTLKTGPKGAVFNSITKDDVTRVLQKKGYKDITVEMEKPIRSLGTHKITAHLGYGITACITITAMSG